MVNLKDYEAVPPTPRWADIEREVKNVEQGHRFEQRVDGVSETRVLPEVEVKERGELPPSVIAQMLRAAKTEAQATEIAVLVLACGGGVVSDCGKPTGKKADNNQPGTKENFGDKPKFEGCYYCDDTKHVGRGCKKRKEDEAAGKIEWDHAARKLKIKGTNEYLRLNIGRGGQVKLVGEWLKSHPQEEIKAHSAEVHMALATEQSVIKERGTAVQKETGWNCPVY